MGKTFLFILFALTFTSCKDMPSGSTGGSGSVPNDSLSIAWDSSSSADVAGYKVYIGRTSGDYYRSFNVGKVLTYTVRNLDPGTYFLVCTAYDTFDVESGYSNEIRATLNSN